ncbi:cyclase family protein [Mesorhizobium sp. M3A.F.Ca.ET.080.04.2.1]|uniref:cyclase family protein n=1 Tax=Mesorhizobium sp. M3A.F.Ca.ET.080.04.2.1 TaxID=2493676 RepID=UPI000F75252B|nr:cyclase family protein [Mesorhizobium sp. M3A.F.Ca.ET.080.04.2.1]AZO07931.1 cyclase family protein [Mesorhizobium sp. M3A.F.Ca.ET.080.04.2.1]RWF23303.1 MAG: cyclase family protein [Mesorhizobium sp.]
MTKRWKVRPQNSNWGEFGDDDQIGRLNLITSECRRNAAKEVIEGLAFCLSVPLDLPGGNLLVSNRLPPTRTIARKEGRPFVNFPFCCDNPDWNDIGSDDAVTIYTQYSTQWDALGHIGYEFDADDDGVAEVVYYNGYRGGRDIVGPDAEGGAGARRLGIENMAETCVQGRGVMVDVFSRFGADRKFVGYDDLMQIMEQDKVVVERGDMLCIHTGWSTAVVERKDNLDTQLLHESHSVLDGSDEKLLRWIDSSGVSAIIADNFAVEGFQTSSADGSKRFPALPLHRRCIVELGIHLGELWLLSPLNAWLKAHGRFRFLLTAPPLRMPGSFGSPLTPVATV